MPGLCIYISWPAKLNGCNTQHEMGPTLCAFSGCKKATQFDSNTEESWNVCGDHLDHAPDMSGIPFQFPGMQLLKLSNGWLCSGQPVPVGQGHNAQAPKCSIPAYSWSCFSQKDGTHIDFCHNRSSLSTRWVPFHLQQTNRDAAALPCSNPGSNLVWTVDKPMADVEVHGASIRIPESSNYEYTNESLDWVEERAKLKSDRTGKWPCSRLQSGLKGLPSKAAC